MGINEKKGKPTIASLPDLLKQWHPTLNDSVKPENVTSGSGQKRWWICEKGHSYQDSPSHKKAGRGCPICSNKQIVAGINDLESLQPKLASEWHPSRNGDLLPSGISPGSNRKAWWLCKKGHEWESVIASRLRSSGCPVCSNKTLVRGQNDLATTNSLLASQWHSTKNLPLRADSVFAGSLSKFWWQCSKGHDWQATGADRVSGKGCPVCSGQKVSKGVNDLATTNPNLAKEWHPTKNGKAKPSDYVAGGKEKFWWQCQNGHEWTATISDRKTGRGCPKCPVTYVYKGSNLLVDVNPSLAAQWHPTLNKTPLSEVAAGSKQKAWWICDNHHQWQAVIGSRQIGRNCPYCSNTLVIDGFNDLQTKAPALVTEWDYEKNAPLLPSQVSLGSNKQIWWVCDKGHEWKASPHNRSKGQGCAVCVNRQLTLGVNDLATTHPALAKQWHPFRNLPLLPTDVITGTAKKFWWVCDKGHEWQANGNSRLRGSGCPACSPTGFDSTRPAILYFIQHDKMLARKVGITNSDARTDRLAGFKKMGWHVVTTYESNPGLVVQTAEQMFFQWLRKDLGLPAYLGSEEMGIMAGWSETFTLDGITNEVVIAQIEALIKKAEAKANISMGT